MLMKISVGICIFNERKNIGRLLDSLLSQEGQEEKISEVIVVSSGSTDNTDRIVEMYSKKNKKIRLVKQDKRRGKSSAINIFLKKAKEDILVLVSGDVIPKKEAIRRLCIPLRDKEIGMVGARPVPVNSNGYFMGFVSNLIWDLHHEVSLQQPKFGELIAFRKKITRLNPTAVDEEELAAIFKKKAYKLVYAPGAVVYNKGPENIKDLILQRRRIYTGHLSLKKREAYSASTMNKIILVKSFLSFLSKQKLSIAQFLWVIFALMIEIYSRLLGYIDFRLGKESIIWKIAKSTKEVRI